MVIVYEEKKQNKGKGAKRDQELKSRKIEVDESREKGNDTAS